MTTKTTDTTAARLARLESLVADLHALTGHWHGGMKPSADQQDAIARLDEFVAELDQANV
jgi:hypothetical protein